MNKKKQHRYPAFTIIELLVVLLLTVMVISISYRVYEMFSKMFLQYKQHAFKMTELTSFQRVLTKDMFNAESVIKTQNGLRCNFDEEFIDYQWKENYIIRNSLKIDTFHLEVLESAFSYGSQEQFTSDAPMDFCSMLLRTDQDSISLLFTKQYGVDQKLRFREKYGY